MLGLLNTAFAPHGLLVLALDDTVERRRGKRIAAMGIYCDPLRSSDSHFVKASGLRWMSLMLLAPVPWAGRVEALPLPRCPGPLTNAPAASEGGPTGRCSNWGARSPCQARRWLSGRNLMLVGDNGLAALPSPKPHAALDGNYTD